MADLEQKRILAAAMRRKDVLERSRRFDGVTPDSAPTAAQQEVLNDLGKVAARYVRAGNQGGKTQTACRECAWVFEENHPTWTRPAEWGDEPLLLLVLCNTLKQFEDVIWRKLREMIDPGCYKIKRSSAGFEKIINTRNGNEILVLSYHNTGDAAIKIQGFVGHWAWIDEMPYSYTIFEETLRRVASRNGSFIATFTPKVRNDSIRRMVDAAQAPSSKVYKFRMFDNPLYASPEKQAEELQKLAGLPENVRKTILDGDWTAGESAVYYFNYDEMAKVPQNYNRSWRHVLAVDPATESKLGLALIAEDPKDGLWYVVRTEYVEGIYVPELIVKAVEDIASTYNIVQRICDTNATWYIRQASHMGFQYSGVYNKKERKDELIKGLQSVLGRKGFVCPWCSDFIEEVTSCSWSETVEGKIVKGQRYHLLDAVQYGIDRLPKFVPNLTSSNWADRLIQEDDKRIKAELTKKGVISHGGRITRGRRLRA